MIKGKILRTYQDRKQSLGYFSIYDNGRKIFECSTLELPWKNNQDRVSCIPTGTYEVTKYSSAKFKNVFLLHNVPDREAILIHQGNYVKDTNGCILIGKNFWDLNKDGLLDITSSIPTLQELNRITPNRWILEITV